MQIPPDSSLPWLLLFFAVMWFGITGFLAVLSGWFSFATRWRAADGLPGERFRMKSASIGMPFVPVAYGNCVTVVVSERGLGLALLFPFRFLSPPLFFPWSQVLSVSEGQFLFFRHVIVQPADHWSRIRLYGEVADKALAASRGRTRGAA